MNADEIVSKLVAEKVRFEPRYRTEDGRLCVVLTAANEARTGLHLSNVANTVGCHVSELLDALKLPDLPGSRRMDDGNGVWQVHYGELRCTCELSPGFEVRHTDEGLYVCGVLAYPTALQKPSGLLPCGHAIADRFGCLTCSRLMGEMGNPNRVTRFMSKHLDEAGQEAARRYGIAFGFYAGQYAKDTARAGQAFTGYTVGCEACGYCMQGIVPAWTSQEAATCQLVEYMTKRAAKQNCRHWAEYVGSMIRAAIETAAPVLKNPCAEVAMRIEEKFAKWQVNQGVEPAVKVGYVRVDREVFPGIMSSRPIAYSSQEFVWEPSPFVQAALQQEAAALVGPLSLDWRNEVFRAAGEAIKRGRPGWAVLSALYAIDRVNRKDEQFTPEAIEAAAMRHEQEVVLAGELLGSYAVAATACVEASARVSIGVGEVVVAALKAINERLSPRWWTNWQVFANRAVRAREEAARIGITGLVPAEHAGPIADMVHVVRSKHGIPLPCVLDSLRGLLNLGVEPGKISVASLVESHRAGREKTTREAALHEAGPVLPANSPTTPPVRAELDALIPEPYRASRDAAWGAVSLYGRDPSRVVEAVVKLVKSGLKAERLSARMIAGVASDGPLKS